MELTGLRHDLGLGTLRSQFTSRFQQQAFAINWALAQGYVDGSAITPAAPDLTDENTNRDERTTEVFIRDRVASARKPSPGSGCVTPACTANPFAPTAHVQPTTTSH